MMSVFISHSIKDIETVAYISRALEEAGHSCWYSSRDIKPGVHYLMAINEAIKKCGWIIVVVTEQSCESKHVLREVEEGIRLQKPVVILRIDMVKTCKALSASKASYQVIDVFEITLDEGIEEALIRMATVGGNGDAGVYQLSTSEVNGSHHQSYKEFLRYMPIIGVSLLLILSVLTTGFVVQRPWINLEVGEDVQGIHHEGNMAESVVDIPVEELFIEDEVIPLGFVDFCPDFDLNRCDLHSVSYLHKSDGLNEWLLDDNPKTTCHYESTAFYNVITFTSQEEGLIHGLGLINGNASNQSNYERCNRVKKVTLTFSDTTTKVVELKDNCMEMQYVTFDEPIMTRSISIAIDQLYPGEMDSQFAWISEVALKE